MNTVCVEIDGEQVVQVRDRANVSDVVALHVEVLQVLVVSELIAEVTNFRVFSVFERERRESV